MTTKIGRNDPCHCGSGQKYKKCCLAKDDASRSAELAALAAKAEEAAKAAQAAADEAEEKDAPGNAGRQAAPKPRGADGGAVKPQTSAARPPPAIRRKAV
jgi:hypothetical protein